MLRNKWGQYRHVSPIFLSESAGKVMMLYYGYNRRLYISCDCYSVIHVIVYIDLMNKEIEGAVEGVKSFYGESRRFLEVCEKPDVSGR